MLAAEALALARTVELGEDDGMPVHAPVIIKRKRIITEPATPTAANSKSPAKRPRIKASTVL